MIRVALTGGIGCGKSVVAAEFAKLGVPCFEADRVAAAYYDDPAFVAEVRRLLGPGIMSPDGGVDKKAVARLVFNDAAMLQQLSQLIHPRVMADFDRWALLHADAPYVICEVAILYEYGLQQRFDKVVCVYLDLEERLRRLVLRDRCSREALMARIANQIPGEEKLMRADYVVLNYECNPRSRQVKYIDRQLRNFN